MAATSAENNKASYEGDVELREKRGNDLRPTGDETDKSIPALVLARPWDSSGEGKGLRRVVAPEPRPRTPILIRLEVKEGSQLIDLSDMADDGFTLVESGKDRARSEPVDGKTSKISPASSSSGLQSTKNKPVRTHRGTRTYSEVVVETLDRSEGEGSIGSIASSSSPRYDLPNQLAFFSGHKKVEKTEGTLHFYKNANPREADIRMVCLLGVPTHLSCQDLLNFFAPALPSIERIKVIRDSTPNKYMMLIRFKAPEDAEMFYTDFNDQQFNTLEPDRCLLLFVQSVDLLGGVEEDELVELPSCAVCLEKLDDGVITIYCRHSFHAECIQKCTDTICPVCRSTQTPESSGHQRCAECKQTTDLWMCLICANVACGRYREAHARRHFEETAHTFAQEVGGRKVWDYAGDNYVHRLIQAEQDGKLVAFERAGLNDVAGDEKMESLTLEYTCLLTNQLDDQRRFFEKKLSDSERARSNLEKLALAQMDDLEAQLRRAVSECTKAREELANTQQAKAVVEKKQATMALKMNKLSEDLQEEKSLNSIVRSDQDKWSKELEKEKKEHARFKEQSQNEIAELREQLRDIMMHFEGQQKLDQQLQQTGVSREELEQGNVVVGPAAEDKKKKRRGSKK